jgi:hypothetical protein
MKKLVVLALLLAVGMLWAQAPAGPTFTMGLRLDYQWANDFGPGKEFSDRPNIELKFNWVADDLTTAYVELEEGPLNSQGDTALVTAAGVDDAGDEVLVLETATGNAASMGGFRSIRTTLADQGYDNRIAGLDKAYFTTNVGKALKLPVPVSVMYGYNEWNNADGIKVTKTEFEDYLGEADIRTWGAQVEIKPDPAITLRSNWAWNPGAMPYENSEFLIGAYGTVAPITYEVTFFTHDMVLGKNWIEGGAEFNQDMTPDVNLAVAFMGEYDMADGAAYADRMGGGPDVAIPAYGWASGGGLTVPDAQLQLQAGVQVMYQKMFGVGLAWRGAEDMWGGALQPQFYYTPKPGDPLEVFLQIGLGLDSDAFDQTFDSLEFAFRYTMGKVQWYLGWLYGVDLNRGIAREWSDFDVAGMVVGKVGGETNAIFMRGNLQI